MGKNSYSFLYLDADNPENIISLASTINGLDRNAITVDNSVSLTPNLDNIFTATELSPDPTYDPNAGKSWWQLHWKKAVQWILFGLAVLATAIVSAINPAAGVAMAYMCIKGALSGLIIGGAIGGIMAAVQGVNFWDGAAQGAIYGAINGYTTAAILYGVTQGISAVVKAANKARMVKQLDPALREYVEMQKALAVSNNQLSSFNTATVAYDKVAGQYFYGMNRGFEASGAMLNSQLAGVTRFTCAEVQAVNSALNAGSQMSNLYLYTIGIEKGLWVAKAACIPCTTAFYGSVAGILSGITL